MASDFAQLKSFLNSARITSSNNALFQCILGIIDGLTELSDDTDIKAIRELISSLNTINLIQAETIGPTSYILDIYVNGMTLFKDITGNAAANPITLVGTVDGVVNPAINTNYGWFGVFLGEDGLFHQWA